MSIRSKQAADILGVNPNTVRNHCKQGILPQEVLMQDFTSIASFSGKLYRLRGYDNQKKLLSKAGDYIEQKQQ